MSHNTTWLRTVTARSVHRYKETLTCTWQFTRGIKPTESISASGSSCATSHCQLELFSEQFSLYHSSNLLFLLDICLRLLFKTREWSNTASVLWCPLACFHLQSIKWALKQQILEQLLMSWPGSPPFPRLICSVDQVRYLLSPDSFQFLGFLSLEGVKREVKPSSLLVV